MKNDDRFFEPFDFPEEQILQHYRNALKDLQIANDVSVLDVKFNYAYQSLIKAGLALLARHRQRVRSVPGHQVKILSRLSLFLNDPEILIIGDMMRAKRNMDFYGGGIFVTKKECEEYLRFVEKVIHNAADALGISSVDGIKERPPQEIYLSENRREVKIVLPAKQPFKKVFQMKITLLDTRPAVWRRIQVPESFLFYELHIAVQNAMGWMDSHLHAFETDRGPRLRDKIRIECPYALDDIEEEDFMLTTEVPLNHFFIKPGDRVFYDYDFGDGWGHQIELEKILPKKNRQKYPCCLDGALACPPEDCGGTLGYEECKAAVRTRNASEELLRWLGDWRPKSFDPAKVVFENPRKRLKESLEE